MKIALFPFVILVIALSVVSAEDSNMQAEVNVFFNKYVQMGDAFDPAVADLYSDLAVIRSYRRYPHGLKKEMALSGTQWKSLIGRLMPLAKSRGDRSIYTDITISTDGNRAKIKANRYAVIKCYTDTGYYMVVEQQSDGRYFIVEEYMETQPESDC